MTENFQGASAEITVKKKGKKDTKSYGSTNTIKDTAELSLYDMDHVHIYTAFDYACIHFNFFSYPNSPPFFPSEISLHR